MKNVRTLIPLLALAPAGLGFSLFACIRGEGNIGTENYGTQNLNFSTALLPVRDCAEAEAVIRAQMIEGMNKRIDAQIESVRKDQYLCSYYGGGSGGGGVADASAAPGSGNSSSGGGSSAPAPSEGDSRASSSSSTNNQVAGVDEADFIKNDGKFMYVAVNGKLRIVDAYPGSQAHTVGSASIDGQARSLFLDGDRVVVFSGTAAQQGAGSDVTSSPRYSSGGCTYGYECVPSGDGTSTKMTVFDVSNRAAPRVVRTVSLSGSFISARKIGKAFHTVVTDPSLTLNSVGYYPDSRYTGCGDGDIESRRAALIADYETLRAKNIAAINQANLRTKFPSIVDSAHGADNLLSSCTSFYRSGASDAGDFTSVVSLDISNNESPTTATVLSKPGHIYASGASLYIGVPYARGDYDGWFGGNTDPLVTNLHKFAISANPRTTAYAASGLVKGGVLNQFAMDEKDGYLRVATSTGHVPDPNVTNSVTVLAHQGSSLNRVGGVDGLAPKEDIRSVRFDGNRAFLVTFKKTDPLFVISLDNPTSPSLLGELKIPGFSTYMHMMNATHLLTIGYDAVDHGDFAFFDSVILQIFDVSNPSAPVLAHKHSIGTRGSSSEALTNHLAFNYFAQKNLLALPMTICENGGDGTYGQNMTFSGLLVFDASTQSGFAERGRIAHPNAAGGTGYNNSLCSNWWTNASSVVKRSVIMDDFVYSIAEDVIRVADVHQLGTPLATVSLK